LTCFNARASNDSDGTHIHTTGRNVTPVHKRMAVSPCRLCTTAEVAREWPGRIPRHPDERGIGEVQRDRPSETKWPSSRTQLYPPAIHDQITPLHERTIPSSGDSAHSINDASEQQLARGLSLHGRAPGRRASKRYQCGNV
jgi:hypothetical protein